MAAAETAKLRFCASNLCQVFTPITFPSAATNGPPLLPPDIAAVVCTA